jgi:hypothetical protein
MDIMRQGQRRHDVSPAVVHIIFRYDENDPINNATGVEGHQGVGDNGPAAQVQILFFHRRPHAGTASAGNDDSGIHRR